MGKGRGGFLLSGGKQKGDLQEFWEKKKGVKKQRGLGPGNRWEKKKNLQ